jgi:hypothetical protein
MNEMNSKTPDLAPITKSERFSELFAIVSSAAPWIGGTISGIIGGIATDLKITRVTQFIKDVLDYVDRLHTQEAEEFVKTEDFADIFDKTAQAVADERHETKRNLFANYILNNIAAPEVSYDLRLKCLRLLEQINTQHLDLIEALLRKPTTLEINMSISAPSTTIERRAPHLRNNLQTIVHETNTLGLTDIKDNYLNLNMTGSGAANLEHSVTTLGRDLIAFITLKE